MDPALEKWSEVQKRERKALERERNLRFLIASRPGLRDEINEMEEQWTNFGTVIFKFWLHISPEEQLHRFKRRETIEHKQWKITEEDYRNRKHWEVYKEAVDEMLYRTSTSFAPWTIIEANSKLYARIKALKTVVNTLEKEIS